MNTISQPQVYTDLNGLNDLKQSAKQDESAALRQAAKQFESVFVRMVLKSMREANNVLAEDGLFSSSQSQFYQNMYDDQLAVTLSEGEGLGLTDVLVEQLSPNVGKTTKTSPEAMSLDFPQVNQARNATGELIRQNIHGKKLAHPTDVRQLTNKEDSNQHVANNGITIAGYTPAADVNAVITVPSSQGFQSAEDFVQKVWPYAQQAARKLGGLDPKVLVAQAALETGWGQHMTKGSNGVNSMNLFNIKADSRWQGDKVSVSTVEYKNGVTVRENADFRQYNSIQASFDDYVNFLQANPRYQRALQNVDNAVAYVQSLQSAGYATDPLYAQKIMQVMQSDVLNNNIAQAN